VRNGKRMMVTALVTGGMAASFGWAQLVMAPAHAAAPPPAQVKVVDAPDPNQPKGYEPADITVKVGQAVNWQNTGTEGHTVTADDNSFDSGMKQHGESWQNTFAKPGQYAYHCTPHPWMKGVVKVAG
jgi:plastocyanin